MTEKLEKPVRIWQLVPDAGTAAGETPSSGAEKTGARPVEDPCDVAFIGPHSFVVADSVGHRLLLVDIARNVCSIVADGQVWPNGVAVSPDGKLLVTDRLTKTVRVYDQRGDRLAVWEPGEEILRRPHGIATTPRGEAIVTDTSRSVVCILAVNDGRLLRQFSSKGDQLQQLRLPFYCAFDSERDEILVSDNMNYCVKIFDGRSAGKTGTGEGYLRRIGSGNSFGQRQFQCPYGVSVDHQSGNVLVADADTNRVFEFAGPTGRFVRYTLTSGADGCRRPSGLAVGPDCGTLVVTESADPDDGQVNVKAYRLHEGVASDASIEQVWTFRTESAV